MNRIRRTLKIVFLVQRRVRNAFIHGVSGARDIHAVGRSTATLCIGLQAQVNLECRVLLLGSMPGVASLQEQRAIPSAQPLLAADGRHLWFRGGSGLRRAAAGVNAAGIGLWDVIGRCERRGSLDADIVRGTEVANALPELIATLPELTLIGCNGAASWQAFQRWVLPQLETRHRWLHCPRPARPMRRGRCRACARPGSRLQTHWRHEADIVRTIRYRLVAAGTVGNSLSRLRAY